MTAVESCEAVQEFFGDEVRGAMRELRVQTASETEQYLVDLLSGFTVSERTHILSEPLFDLLQRARAAQGAADQARRLRDLGDAALFLSGFFPDSFERRGWTRDYVAAMGGQAYSRIGDVDVLRASQGARAVFIELARRFVELSQVLDEVRERTALCTDGAIVRLYERFRESGSPALLRRLRRRGVHPERPRRPRSLH
jgi:hypothetical protein